MSATRIRYQGSSRQTWSSVLGDAAAASEAGSAHIDAPAVQVDVLGGIARARCPVTVISGLFWGWRSEADGQPTLVVGLTPREVIEEMSSPVSLSDDVVREWTVGHFRPEVTPYAGVGRVPPGCTARWPVPGGPPIIEHWCCPDTWNHLSPLHADPVDAMQRAMSDVLTLFSGQGASPLAVTLSGGLDSTFMTAILATTVDQERPIHAFVHRPLPGVPLPEGVVGDEWDAVVAFNRALGGRFQLHALERDPADSPLDASAAFAEESWLPALMVPSTSWFSQARSEALGLGATDLLVGGHGNASFSHPHGYAARHYAARGDLRGMWRLAARSSGHGMTSYQAWRSRVLGPAVHRYPRTANADAAALFPLAPRRDQQVQDRAAFLEYLRPDSSGFYALHHPGVDGARVLDPYHSATVIDLAARIRPSQWRQGPGWRSFARLAGAGLVPDTIRLDTAMKRQSADYWYLIRNQRDRFYDEIALLDRTPSLSGFADPREIRTMLDRWPWGEPSGPARIETVLVGGLLVMAAWARSMPARLARQTS